MTTDWKCSVSVECYYSREGDEERMGHPKVNDDNIILHFCICIIILLYL